MGVLTRIRRWGVAIAIVHGVASAVAQVAPPPVPPNPLLAAAIEQNEGIKPLVMTTEEVPVAYPGLPYHSSIRMEGGEGPYSVFVSGDFPRGLVNQTGVNVVTFSGVPTVAGTFSSQVTVYDVNGVRKTHDYTFVVRDLSPPAPAFIHDPEAVHINDAESIFFPAVINVPEAFHIDDSLIDLRSAEYALPEAFHINDQTTVILAEQYALPEAFHINDATTIKVLLGVTPTTAPTGNVNVAYSQTFTAVGSTGAATLTPSGALPSGMSFTTTAGSVKLSGTPTQDGIYPFTITAQDMVNTVSVAYSLVIVGISQTITFVAPTSPVLYGVSPIALSATGGASGNPVVFSIDASSTGTGLISGTTLTVKGVGSIVIDANQPGNTNYAAAPQVQQTLVVNAAPQTISFPAPASPVNYGVPPITLAATGGASGNRVVFSVVSGPASVSGVNGATLTITGVGTVVIAADQAGNIDYAAAAQVKRSIVVTGIPAALTTPAPGSTLPGPSVTFDWTADSGATGYYLWIGSTGVGSNNIYNSAEKTGTSYTFTSMPLNGETIYVRLITNTGGKWISNDYTYTAATTAAITSPSQGAIFTGPTTTFTWSPATGAVSGYYLWIGSTGVGSNNLYNSAEKTVTSYTFNSLPTNGEPIYVRLTTNFNGIWAHTDYAYTAATAAAMTSPTAGSTFTGASVTFNWTTIPSATGYYLEIGSTGAGSNDIYNSAEKTVTTYTFPRMPTNGETIYVRLITNFSGVWVHNDYTYKAYSLPAALTAPTPGSTLAGASVTFDWTAPAGATGYYLWIGSQGVGSNDIYNSAEKTVTTYTFPRVPTNGETIYVRLITNYNGTWVHNDYTYTAAN
jgi:hypothetical protein